MLFDNKVKVEKEVSNYVWNELDEIFELSMKGDQLKGDRQRSNCIDNIPNFN